MNLINKKYEEHLLKQENSQLKIENIKLKQKINDVIYELDGYCPCDTELYKRIDKVLLILKEDETKE